MIVQLREVAKSDAKRLGARLGAFFWEAHVRETVTDSRRGGCCAVC